MATPSWQQLPFDEAISWLKNKLAMPTSNHAQIVREAQDWAFTVAGVAKADFLLDLQRAIAKALEKGTTLEEFTRDFDEAAARTGWVPAQGSDGLWGAWRMELIFMQNLRSAYSAGRFQQMRDPDVAQARPYWLWRHGDSVVPRPAHLALDGKVFRGDSVFWDVAHPPNAFGCQCQAFSLSERDLQARGLTVEEPPDETVTVTDRITGDRLEIPAINGQAIVEPGFAHAAGSSQADQRADILRRSLDRLPPEMARQVRDEIDGGN